MCLEVPKKRGVLQLEGVLQIGGIRYVQLPKRSIYNYMYRLMTSYILEYHGSSVTCSSAMDVTHKILNLMFQHLQSEEEYSCVQAWQNTEVFLAVILRHYLAAHSTVGMRLLVYTAIQYAPVIFNVFLRNCLDTSD